MNYPCLEFRIYSYIMSNIITDKDKIEEVITRGVELIYPDKEQLRELLASGKRIKLYCGFDPSAPSLHIGNAILINKLSQFQKLGHEVIFLVGDFTGMIGDPTDKTAARVQLSAEEVKENAKHFKDQASAYLDFDGDNPARVEYNSSWLSKLTFEDIIELSAHFTVGRMIQRDMFQERMKNEKPIHLHEFLYPLAQGYDCVALDVDLEVGGNDQMFNMMCGRDLMKAMKGKEKLVLTGKLFADNEGKKMGKTEGNAVFLDQEAKNIYGAVMSWSDEVIIPGFEMATQIPMQEVEEMQKDLGSGAANPRDLKMKLAWEITKIIQGKDKADQAQDYFVKTIQNKEAPDEVEIKKLDNSKYELADLLLEAGLAPSKGEARRVIEQGGVKIDGEVVADPKEEVDISEERLVQKGKRSFVKIVKN